MSSSLPATQTILILFLSIFCLVANPTTAHEDDRREVAGEEKEKTTQRTPAKSDRESFDFSGTGRPGNQTAGENRGSCPVASKRLTAIVPDSHFGRTTVGHPNFWAYVPYSAERVVSIEFVLQDELDRDILRSTVPIAENPGYIKFSLPKTAKPLEVGKSYQWYLKITCNLDNTPPLYVRGWIERIDLAANLDLALQNSQEPAHLTYALYGVWYDAMDKILSSKADNNLSRLQRDWEILLAAKGVSLKLPSPEFCWEIVKDFND